MERNIEKLTLAGATLPVVEAITAGMHIPGPSPIIGVVAAATVYAYGDAIAEKLHAIKSARATRVQAHGGTEKEKRLGELSLAYRLFHGKSLRENQQENKEAQPKEASREEIHEEGQTVIPELAITIPPLFNLDTELEVIKQVNKKGYVYFGRTATGIVALPLNNMYHIFDVSSSGKGKSNRFRLALMQMVNTCETYFISPFANNVKAVLDSREIEVWKPLFDRLATKRPIKKGPEIFELMTTLVQAIDGREEMENRGDFSWQNKPIFVFIDELPEVFARCPETIDLLDQIGRTGRQFCVFTYVASQTAAVSETGQSTAAQANYKTRIYGGGDRNSSGRMMKCTIPKEDEVALQSNGAGLTLMLADGFPGLAFVRAPLVTNEGLFAYFGLPPFNKKDWIVQPEKKDEIPLLVPQPVVSGETPRVKNFDLTQNFEQGDTRPGDITRQVTNEPVEPVGDLPTSDLPVGEGQASRPGKSYPLMNPNQIRQFIALYPANGVEKSLDQIKGCAHKHREHARDIIRQYNLQRMR